MKNKIKNMDGQAVVGFVVVFGLSVVAIGMPVFAYLTLR